MRSTRILLLLPRIMVKVMTHHTQRPISREAFPLPVRVASAILRRELACHPVQDTNQAKSVAQLGWMLAKHGALSQYDRGIQAGVN